MARPRIGFIIQRYGTEVVGGAESLCRALARKLAGEWDIEVLTTCAVDYMTWENAYPAGVTEVEGVKVRRFTIDRPRNIRRFNRLSAEILARPHSLEHERRWMALQGPKSTDLGLYIERHADRYDGFVLFNYLYATTYDNLARVAGRFYLVPFAHDEPPIYLRIFEDVFRSPRAIAFCTEAEREFVRRRFPFPLPPSQVIGMGIEPPRDADPERFRSKFSIRGPFMLYAGRIDESKGCDELLRDFAAYRVRAGDAAHSLSLVLCGHSRLTIPRRDDIRYLGFVGEQDKWDALAAARCLVLPSRFESLSIVLLEAWAAGKPVLANGECAVSKSQCALSGGGLLYRNTDEFAAAADLLARDDLLCRRLGESGRRFVERNYAWPTVTRRYLDLMKFDR